MVKGIDDLKARFLKHQAAHPKKGGCRIDFFQLFNKFCSIQISACLSCEDKDTASHVKPASTRDRALLVLGLFLRGWQEIAAPDQTLHYA